MFRLQRLAKAAELTMNVKIGIVRRQLQMALATISELVHDESIIDSLARAAEDTAGALANGRKLLIVGNGGSAADAQHLAAEFVGRLRSDRPPMRAMALTVDSSILTAIGNDYGYDKIFERQIEAIGH